ncbi:MAG TPA: secretin N-terminal domain-containing protein [Lacunisphaera sp.]|jgi:type IV pilus assembly protein PilQ|nr:secretin N-terminal domain-containing protein [Lacunisphaera sp.]
MSTRRTLLTAILATAISLPAFAQDATPAPTPTQATPTQATPAEATPAAPAVTVEGSKPAAAPVSRDKDTLSVDFPDEEIKTILRNVADLFELNLVVPETLQGKTSIKLRDVTWRQIFQVVLSPVGYTYVEEGNIIKIVSNESLQQEPGTTEVFILNNAKAADIKPTIDGLIDAASGGKIVIDARSNALVITERPSRMGRIRTIIDQLDKATDQVMIESKFIEVSDRDIRNIGVNWASLDHMQFGVGGIKQQWDKNNAQDRSSGTNNTNGNNTTTTSGTSHGTTSSSGTSGSTTAGTTSLTSTGGAVTYVTAPSTINPANGAFTTSTINLADGSVTGLPSSVPASTSVTGFTPATSTTPASFTATNTYTGSNTNGTNGSTSNGTSSSTSITDAVSNAVDNTISNAINNLASLTNTASQSRVATAVFSASDFNIVISALKTQNNTKIVSNPTIVTLNNTEATLNIGEEFPVPSYTYNSERGTFEVSGFNYKPIGVILKVTPQVNGRGVIKMTLEPEVSQRNGETSFGGAGGASIPIIATRKVKTQVSLQDGYTMGIGGLITTNQSHGGTKVPVLGDIPLLGRLFSSKSINDISSNLLIFITAKTVSADGASPEEVFDPRAVEAVGMSREDLPPHRAPKGTDLFANPEPAKK